MYSHKNFEIPVGKLISSASWDYEVQHLLGSGSFGAVSQCRKVATNETVALKILKNSTSIQDGKKEEAILKFMKGLGSEKFNIVMWKDSFSYEGFYCLEFEKLDINLLTFLKRSKLEALKPMEIRPIVHQLAKALSFLKHAGVVHADLKPENIMMVDHLKQPLRVKVIDFGLAIKNPAAHVGRTLQTLWYRSPEVLLGASFDEAIDVWSLGCIAVQLFLGTPLFPCTDEYDLMRHIVCTIGKPPDRLLNTGLHTRFFFMKQYGEESNPWRFMSVTEEGHVKRKICPISCLHDLNMVLGEDADADSCDQTIFIQLIREMLKVDPAERIKPNQILQHPFVTMSHLVDKFGNSFHVKSCVEYMRNVQGDFTSNGDEAQLSLSTCQAEGPPSKKRRVINLKKDATDCDKEKLGRHSPAQEGPLKKRKRADEEASGSNRTDADKKRKRTMEGEEKTTLFDGL